MPMSRNQLISLAETPHYHPVGHRCVRRQFQCELGAQTAPDFTHRRDWIRARLFQLAVVCSIVVCARVVLSDHCLSGLQASWRTGSSMHALMFSRELRSTYRTESLRWKYPYEFATRHRGWALLESRIRNL